MNTQRKLDALLKTYNVTNVHNLDYQVCKAILKDRYTDENDKPSDFSATTLIAPTQQTVLRERHESRPMDVTDYTWSFFGSVIHQVLEDSADEEEEIVQEERLYMDISGITLSGKLDCYFPNRKMILDYKSTKAYKIMKGDYTDWAKQLNVYAALCRANNMPVEKIMVQVIVLDWSPVNTYKEGYPETAWPKIEIPLWNEQITEEFIHNQVDKFILARALSDDDLAIQYPCSASDRWMDVSFAVMKKGGKRATKVFDNKDEAEIFAAEKGKNFYVEDRQTEPRRCASYCDVSHKCKQYLETKVSLKGLK
jgi:hypothetical protein